tara:strand:- start:320 stop:1204 length:885 start_codon:yes stop_codon:yes gene_type:complete
MLQNKKWVGPIFDQHLHLDRSNRFLDAISDFVNSGGTGVMLVHKPAFSGKLPQNLDGYREAYLDTISMADEIRMRYEIEVGVVLGPHPVVWEKQIDKLGIKKSTELHLEAVGLALDFIDSGQANCLGEVGRPHYPVSEDIWESANEMLEKILQMACSSKTSVQLHVEDNGERTYRDILEICDKSGLSPENTIRHFAPANISSEFTHNIPTTVSMGKSSVDILAENCNKTNSKWGMETDFLDDKNRPGAVLGPKTVPKRTGELCSKLLSDGWDDSEIENLLYNVHQNWPKSLYNL